MAQNNAKGGGPPSGQAGGDLTGTYPDPVVAKINETTINTAGGALVTGKVLRVTGVATADYGAVDLANSNSITGLLPNANQAVQTLAGDVSGNTGASTVDKIKGKTLNAALSTIGATQDGYALTWVNGSTDWEAKPIPAGFTAGGDLSGSTTSQNVVKIQNKTLSSTLTTIGATQDGYALTWVNGSSDWEAKPIPAGFTAGGDLSGSTTSQNVNALHSATTSINVSSSAAPTSGKILTATSSTAATWQTPAVQTATGTAGGDLTGTYPNPTVAKINGFPAPTIGAAVTGNVLVVNGATTALFYSPILLGNGAGFVSGTLPVGNQDKQIMGGDISGTTDSATVTQARGLKSATTTVSVSAAAAPTAGDILTATNSTTATWVAPAGGPPTGAASGDLGGTYPSPTVLDITGASGVVDISSAGNILTWNTATTAPGIKQTDKTTNGGTGAALTIQAQNETGTTSTGGALNLTSGTGTTAAGAVVIKTGGTTRLTANATGVITVANLGTGIVQSDASGNLTSSAFGGDISGATASAAQVDIARGLKSATTTVAVSAATAPTSGQVLTAINSTTANWATPSPGGSAGGDLGGTYPNPTVVQLTGDGTNLNILGTTRTLRFSENSNTPQIMQAQAVTGTSGQPMYISPQGAKAASNGSGGDLYIQTGTKQGSGINGSIFFYIGNSTLALTIASNGAGTTFDQSVTISSLGTGLVHSSSAGLLSSSTLVNADVSASAAIDVSKLAAGTSAQILLNTATPTPTWTTISGDATIGATGSFSVNALRSATTSVNVSSATAPTSGQVLTASSGTAATWVTPTVGGAAGGDLTGTYPNPTLAKLQGKTLATALASVGATQDGYVLTWVNGSTEWQAKPSAGGVGSGVTTVGAIDTNANSNGLFISGVNISTQSASVSNPGMVNITTQSFAGAKTFTSALVYGSTTGVNTHTGGNIWTTRTLAADLTIDTTTKDMIILTSTAAARNITLPAPVNGRMFIIKDSTGQAETNNITLIRNGAEKIEGVAASRILSTNWGKWTIVSDGTDWFMI